MDIFKRCRFFFKLYYITIAGVNGYSPFFFRRYINGNKIIRAPDFVILFSDSDIIKNINQIIKDFTLLASYIENLEDIESERFNNKSDDWFWADETNLEKRKIENYEQIEFKRNLEVIWTLEYPPHAEARNTYLEELERHNNN
jgi:hypothetical protein